MLSLRKILIFIGLLLTLVSTSLFARAFWEIRDPNLPYIAKIRAGRGDSYTVIYNSKICEQIGEDACMFFREHADAHETLNHPLYDPEYYTQTQEDQADCYAARVSKPEEVRAAVELMESDEAANYPITGDPKQRAKLIRDCAIKHDNWKD
jgi:hypothetical protein